jgi:hypothetical protein
VEYREELASMENPGFYHVPGYEHIEISVDGKIINTEDLICPLQKLWGGYPAVSIGRGQWMHVHRLLALTFVENPYPDLDLKMLEVNHIDGVKTNNALDNLEWVTWSGNILHAYQNGLRTDNRPVLVKDLRTEEIRRFYSLTNCAQEFKLDPSLLHVYLRPYNRGKISKDYYVFIYEGDDWPPLTKDDIGQYRNGTAKAVVATNLVTGEALFFSSMAKVAEFFYCKLHAVRKHLLSGTVEPFRGWNLRFVSLKT